MNPAMQGICQLSIIPLRSEPGERSEMVTQLLFGETYRICDERDSWLLVSCDHDGYEGWIDKKMSTILIPGPVNEYNQKPLFLLQDPVGKAINTSNNLPVILLKGSRMRGGENEVMISGEVGYQVQGQFTAFPTNSDMSRLEREALTYINTPYLWGGRTPLGIDCSGFVQMVYMFCGVFLPRDAADQALQGTSVDFVYESLPGDLAFFDNSASRITHVGILLGEGQIIHSSGNVRIDSIDHNGIFNRQTGKYTHNLRIIKRLNS
jgi:cell wall-associated NlpC family hydrolase